jgi:hypothetical protein
MKNFGHIFISIPHSDLGKYNLLFAKHDEGFCYICSICNLITYKIDTDDGDSFYAGKGVGNESIVNVSCEEYIIKKLLE